MIFEMKLLREIFGPRLEDNQWRMRRYAELKKMYSISTMVPAFNSDVLMDGIFIVNG